MIRLTPKTELQVKVKERESKKNREKEDRTKSEKNLCDKICRRKCVKLFYELMTEIYTI